MLKKNQKYAKIAGLSPLSSYFYFNQNGFMRIYLKFMHRLGFSIHLNLEIQLYNIDDPIERGPNNL